MSESTENTRLYAVAQDRQTFVNVTWLQRSDNGGETWASPIWTKGGDQGDVWNRDTINVSSYIGDTILFRFRSVTAANWESDVSIDAVQFYDLNFLHRSTD